MDWHNIRYNIEYAIRKLWLSFAFTILLVISALAVVGVIFGCIVGAILAVIYLASLGVIKGGIAGAIGLFLLIWLCVFCSRSGDHL